MGKREEILDCIDNRRADSRIFSPLADSLFAASAAGKLWVSETTLDDQISAAQECGYHPMFVRGSTPDLTVNPALDVTCRMVSSSEEGREYEQAIETPKGKLVRKVVDRPGEGMTPIDTWISDAGQLDIADWISEDVASGNQDARILDTYREFADATRPYGVSQVQVELPFFLYSLPGFAQYPVLFSMTEPERYPRSMDLAMSAILHVCEVLIASGVDMIWIGAGGTEMLSPDLWETWIIPQSQAIVARVHELGGRVHFHCCGQSNLWIENGYLDRIGMDVVETLSPPPSGTVNDLGRARASIDPRIVTKGNVDLGLIRGGAPEQCMAAIRSVIDATRGSAHIAAAADALLYGTPIENVRAMQAECARG